MLAASGKFQSVTALDHIRFEKYTEFHPDCPAATRSIVELPFDDDEFDVVTCMEVLEHVPDEVLEPGIAELRRVCRGQLIMSVPFEEAEPLSKGHMRRFESADVHERFPDAGLTLLDRPRMPWLIIEERLDGTPFDPPVTLDDLPSADGTDTAAAAPRCTRGRSRPAAVAAIGAHREVGAVGRPARPAPGVVATLGRHDGRPRRSTTMARVGRPAEPASQRGHEGPWTAQLTRLHRIPRRCCPRCGGAW